MFMNVTDTVKKCIFVPVGSTIAWSVARLVTGQREPVRLLPPGMEPELGAAGGQPVMNGTETGRRSAGRTFFLRVSDQIVESVRFSAFPQRIGGVCPPAIAVRVKLDEVVRRFARQDPVGEISEFSRQFY